MGKLQKLIEDARDPAHPFHDFFEWDDEKAAKQWRLRSAVKVIRVVKWDFEEQRNKCGLCFKMDERRLTIY